MERCRTMSRNLIDRDVLLEKAKQEQRFYKDEYDAMESGYLDEERAIVKEAYSTMTDCVSLINNAPIVDAVEVVRCRDCKYYKEGFCYNPNNYDDEKTCGNTSPDWFCADGEREEQNDE